MTLKFPHRRYLAKHLVRLTDEFWDVTEAERLEAIDYLDMDTITEQIERLKDMKWYLEETLAQKNTPEYKTRMLVEAATKAFFSMTTTRKRNVRLKTPD